MTIPFGAEQKRNMPNNPKSSQAFRAQAEKLATEHETSLEAL